MAAAPVVHFEVMGQDGDKLQSFYSDLFDWKIDSRVCGRRAEVDPAARQSPAAQGSGPGSPPGAACWRRAR